MSILLWAAGAVFAYLAIGAVVTLLFLVTHHIDVDPGYRVFAFTLMTLQWPVLIANW